MGASLHHLLLPLIGTIDIPVKNNQVQNLRLELENTYIS